MTKLIVALRNFSNAPDSCNYLPVITWPNFNPILPVFCSADRKVCNCI